jgi:low affinity Fe/Cu permease
VSASLAVAAALFRCVTLLQNNTNTGTTVGVPVVSYRDTRRTSTTIESKQFVNFHASNSETKFWISPNRPEMK